MAKEAKLTDKQKKTQAAERIRAIWRGRMSRTSVLKVELRLFLRDAVELFFSQSSYCFMIVIHAP